MSIEEDATLVSSAEVSCAELDSFVAAYRTACEQALSETPRLERGAWCRFCPAKPICPAHTAPLLDLAQFPIPAPPSFNAAFATPPEKEVYLRTLADRLTLVDTVKDLRTALHDQAKRALESGDCVPGSARHWKDESAAIAALKGLGLAHGDVVAEELRSPKEVEIRAKAHGLKIPSESFRPAPAYSWRGTKTRTPGTADGTRLRGRFPRRYGDN
jgi:hypothetical protein